ncbi:hypothetical protein [Parashewanella tropica]|uniref:hypothetical protein n=1 Tax=Parashewanella tropica TaxID=2547970 RepID=UPI001059C513|nr:hypothetical protein [Parashewanella tropica]
MAAFSPQQILETVKSQISQLTINDISCEQKKYDGGWEPSPEFYRVPAYIGGMHYSLIFTEGRILNAVKSRQEGPPPEERISIPIRKK